MQQGRSLVNGPHQGAWVNDTKGNDWFLHFQDKDTYGRIVHLQPMKWKNDFPVIGEDNDGDDIGEPVMQYQISSSVLQTAKPKLTFDFSEFQWQANPKQGWGFKGFDGTMRLFSVTDSNNKNLWFCPHIFTQKFPTESFSATAKIMFNPSPKMLNEKFGMIVLGTNYAYIAITKKEDKYRINFSQCLDADKGKNEIEMANDSVNTNEIYFKVVVAKGAICNFYFSTNNKDFTQMGNSFKARPGKWVGAKLGFFFNREAITNDAGCANISWLKIEEVM